MFYNPQYNKYTLYNFHELRIHYMKLLSAILLLMKQFQMIKVLSHLEICNLVLQYFIIYRLILNLNVEIFLLHEF